MRPIDELREKIDLWKKSTTDTALMSVLHDVLKQIDVAIYEMDHQEAESQWHRVEEDYPDLLQFVVVCNDDGKCVVAQYVGYQTGSLTPWRIAYTMYDTDAYYEMENGPVRYWMPIEPPKED